MSKIASKEALQEAIRLLELKQAGDEQRIKAHAALLVDSLKPANLIRETVRELAASEDFKQNLLIAAAGIATGFIAKLILERNSENALNQMASGAAQYGVTDFIAKHPEEVKAIVQYVIAALKHN